MAVDQANPNTISGIKIDVSKPVTRSTNQITEAAEHTPLKNRVSIEGLNSNASKRSKHSQSPEKVEICLFSTFDDKSPRNDQNESMLDLRDSYKSLSDRRSAKNSYKQSSKG